MPPGHCTAVPSTLAPADGAEHRAGSTSICSLVKRDIRNELVPSIALGEQRCASLSLFYTTELAEVCHPKKGCCLVFLFPACPELIGLCVCWQSYSGVCWKSGLLKNSSLSFFVLLWCCCCCCSNSEGKYFCLLWVMCEIPITCHHLIACRWRESV